MSAQSLLDQKFKLLILLRHPESLKNREDRFSSDDGAEQLVESESALSEARVVVDALRAGLDQEWLIPTGVHIATSPHVRCASFARALAAQLQVVPTAYAGLASMRSGRVGGLSLEEARVQARDFVDALSLYRVGLASSHRIAGYGESLDVFEERVRNAIDSALRAASRLTVVVAHRSSITATLIRYARCSLEYPVGFFGYVPVDLGKAYALFLGSDGRVIWCALHEPLAHLAQRLREVIRQPT